MNTRLQVEHPITEMVTGVDLVQWQIRIARGERLTIDPDGAARRRAATPSSAASTPRIRTPASCRRRAASRRCASRRARASATTAALEAGGDVPIFYDPLISKLVAWGDDRPQAIARMRRALGEYDVVGIKTTLPFFRWMLEQPDFLEARFHTSYLDELLRRAPASRSRRLTMQRIDVAIIAARHSAGEARTARDQSAGPGERSRGRGRRGPAPRASGVILRIESGGRTRAVDVSRSGDRFLVSIDGRRHEVDVKEIDGIRRC